MLYPFIQWTARGEGFNIILLTMDAQINKNVGKHLYLQTFPTFFKYTTAYEAISVKFTNFDEIFGP